MINALLSVPGFVATKLPGRHSNISEFIHLSQSLKAATCRFNSDTNSGHITEFYAFDEALFGCSAASTTSLHLKKKKTAATQKSHIKRSKKEDAVWLTGGGTKCKCFRLQRHLDIFSKPHQTTGSKKSTSCLFFLFF